MIRKISVAILFSLILVSCYKNIQYPNCQLDNDCSVQVSGLERAGVCYLGKCEECVNDANCGDNFRCTDFRCEAYCDVDAQCGVGLFCIRHACVGKCGVGEFCATDETCINGFCMSNSGFSQCTSDSQCEEGFVCDTGLCTRRDEVTVYPQQAESCINDTTFRFDYDKSNLNSGYVAELDDIARCLLRNPEIELSIEGHTDVRGTAEYNMSLGERRAKAVCTYLEGLGIGKERLKMVSWGEERTLADGESEPAHAQNRRVEIIVQ